MVISKTIDLRNYTYSGQQNEKRLLDLFSIYKTNNLLATVSPLNFQKKIESLPGTVDYETEGYKEGADASLQRDLSVKYVWGHDHDFGVFSMPGRMADRHIKLMASFMAAFNIEESFFRQKRCLDIGAWTGGTSLLLAALGSKHVCAVEEVKKYAKTITFLSESFGFNERIRALPISLYELDHTSIYDQFDLVYFPGVLYHLTDPVVALRILYNSMKVGGVLLLETATNAMPHPNRAISMCFYEGCLAFHPNPEQSHQQLNRGGWNWFIPSPTAIGQMLEGSGFNHIKILLIDGRAFAIAIKDKFRSICRAGLSKPNIR